MLSGHRDGIWHRKVRHASKEKRQTTSDCQTKTKLERPEKRKSANTWAYWKLTPSNKWRWKKKLRKYISGEPEACLRQNYIAETLSKEKTLGLRKTDYSHQKRYWQHENQQKDTNQKTKMARKTNLRTFWATNKQHITRENMNVAKKGKS